MLMLPGEEGSEVKEKNAGEKRQKKYYFFKQNPNWFTPRCCDLGGTFYNDTFVLSDKPDCIYAFLIPSNICEYFTHTY